MVQYHDGFVAVIRRKPERAFIAVGGEIGGEVTPEVTQEVTPEVRLLKAIKGEMTRQDIQKALGLKDDEHFRTSYLLPALRIGLVEMTIPDKPWSSKQKYRLTKKGRQFLNSVKE